MSQLRILVIEDNPVHAGHMEMLLDELGYELIDMVDNATDALRLFKATRPDLVLTDIGLKDDTDGISIAARLNALYPVPVIFTTSFADSKTFERAKATEPYAYLIKPIEKTALQTSIELAVVRFAKDYVKEAMNESPYRAATKGLLSRDCFFVKTTDGLEKVRFNDVLWAEATINHYCEIVTENKRYKLRSSLKQLEEKLPTHQFIRSHRTHIVNILKVENIYEQDMTLGIGKHRIPLGQGRKQAIMDMLNIF